VRLNGVSRPELASGETELHLPPKASLRRDGTASPAQKMELRLLSRASLRQERIVSLARVASGEMELRHPSRAGLGRDGIASST
jgi:hypothetical protein